MLGLLGALSIAWLLIVPAVGGLMGGIDSRYDLDQAARGLEGIHLLRDRHGPDCTRASDCARRDRRLDLSGSGSGTLTHMCVTDLTNSEIVLGKLAARLLPVLSLVLATCRCWPSRGSWGNHHRGDRVADFDHGDCLPFSACSLAMAISVRATKTHEVLMAVYGIEALWVLGP